MANQRISDETRERVRAAWLDICGRLAAGELVKDVRVLYGITPGQQRAYLAEVPEARKQWEDARELSADAFLEEAMDVARGMPNSTESERATRAQDGFYDRRVHVDTLKWAARIRNPRAYGDKQQLDVNVRTVDLTRIISEAQARIAAYEQGRRRLVGESSDARLIEHAGVSELL